MPYKFTCASCGVEVTVQFLRPGELYKCKCGVTSMIPENADPIVGDATSVSTEPVPGQATISTNSAVSRPKLGPFVITGIIVNTLWIIANLVGTLTEEGTASDFMGVLWNVGVCGATVAVLWGKRPTWRRVAIGLNAIVFLTFGFVALLVSTDDQARLGGLMLVIIGAINLIILTLMHEDGIIRLYFERKRLEEMKKISDLEKQLKDK